jgi:hypothetical protein
MRYTKRRRPVMPTRSFVPTDDEKNRWNLENEEGPDIERIVTP